MPLYDFKCYHCGYEVEVSQGVGDAPPKCINCVDPDTKVAASMSRCYKFGTTILKGLENTKS